MMKNSDILAWDTVNWSKALNFWKKNVPSDKAGLKCLELGGNEGGLSLWLASLDHSVICSDLENPHKTASKLHDKFPELQSKIEYQAIDALKIPFENEFDIIVFKSILGGISRDGQDEKKKEVIDQIYKALKPGGKLLFAENLEASSLHIFFRKKFVKWGAAWNYLRLNEVSALFSNFSDLSYGTAGFLGTFGRSEKQRQLLGYLDHVIEKLLPKKSCYIVYGVAKK